MKQTFDLDAKTRILDAAEQLFAEQGFEGTSLRQITTAANVNLAAVNYHFHSKEELIHAVFARRIEPVNRKRLEMLGEVEGAAGDGPPCLEAVMEAFYGPIVELHRHPEYHFQPLMGRAHTEPGVFQEYFLEQMMPVGRRFVAALQRALPELPPEDFFWRLQFCVGAMAFTMAGAYVLNRFAGGICDPTDVEGTTGRLVEFSCAGLRAPVKGKVWAETI